MDEPKKTPPLRVPKPIPLTFDVQELTGKILIRKGELFSPRLLQKLSRATPSPRDNVLLRDHPVFGKDLFEAINKIPFHHLFNRNPCPDYRRQEEC